MLTDEARLLDKISQGDEIAFSGLLTYYYPKVITFLSELIADEKDVEDLSQNIFVKVWLHRSTLRNLRSFGAYLYRMCRNAAIDYGRTHRVRIPFELPQNEPVGYPLDESYFAQEKRFQIDHHVAQMPQKRQQVFRMSREEGKTNEEIARELGLSKKTVENHINAALRELRKLTSCISIFF